MVNSSKAQDVQLEWVKQIGGTEEERPRSLAVDVFGNVYSNGGFSGTVDFDPEIGETSLSSVDLGDIFILKLGDLTSDVDEPESTMGILIYPNPTFDIITIGQCDFQEIYIQVFDVTGKLLLSKITSDQNTSLDLGRYASGIYFINIFDSKNTITQRIIKQ
jgi:hypothetical protein